jgi:hypothetical protein
VGQSSLNFVMPDGMLLEATEKSVAGEVNMFLQHMVTTC